MPPEGPWINTSHVSYGTKNICRDAILPDLGEMMICMYIYTSSPINFVEKTKWYELKRKNQFSKYVPHFIANDIAM